MAKKISESKVTRFKYRVINDEFFVEVTETMRDFNGEMIPYYDCYLQHGEYGFKTFCYGRPQTDRLTGEFVSVKDAVKSIETFLLSSIMTYLEKEDALNEYYASKEE